MKFCPKCNNIMDIGKNMPKIIDLINTPQTVSTDNSNSNIETETETEIKTKIDTGIETDNKTKLSDLDEMQYAYLVCKNCSYFEQLQERTLVFSRMNDDMSSTQIDLNRYKYITHDKTLPHTRDYICNNVNCESHKNYLIKDAVWFRPNPNSYSTYYACCICQTIWNQS
jgi:hypothetical protein